MTAASLAAVPVKMLRRQVSMGVMVWIVIGLIVAAQKDFLDHLASLSRLLSAILAVIVWPLVLLKIHFGV
jgi:putative Mn2+ efflux pump MntP